MSEPISTAEHPINPSAPTRHRTMGGVTPVGHLGETLNKFEAPPEVQTAITRRIGGVVGSSRLPNSDVEQIIEDSMKEGNGMPNWPKVQAKLGEKVVDAYHRFKRRF